MIAIFFLPLWYRNGDPALGLLVLPSAMASGARLPARCFGAVTFGFPIFVRSGLRLYNFIIYSPFDMDPDIHVPSLSSDDRMGYRATATYPGVAGRVATTSAQGPRQLVQRRAVGAGQPWTTI